MICDCHQDGANDKHYDVHLQCPFAANTLGDYRAMSVTRQKAR
jgi:hypothetical protein